jgi:sigma-B regulation protein RsbU (phosphoserine phosphatase)
MFVTTYRMVENNPAILGGTISFIPNYYPQKGYWFEPYAVRRTTPDGRETIETIQLGSASHDYTKSEFFTVPIAQNCGHWSEPYLDADGARAMVTTYGTPVHDRQGKTVAVVDADLSLEWLDNVIAEEKTYQSTNRFLVTGSHHLLAGEDGPELQAALKLLKTTGNKESYHKVKNEEGKKQHVFFQPVGGMTDWVLITVLDDSDVFGNLRKTRLMLYVLTGIGLLFLGFIVYRTSRNLEKLRRVNAAKERIESELRIARDIQMSMVPGVFPQHEGLDMYAEMNPAKEVGGDLYSYVMQGNMLYFCVGDVSGKGVPASLFMAQSARLFRTLAAEGMMPADIAVRMNNELAENNDQGMFVTMFMGLLHLDTGRLDYCNCGHNPPVIDGQFLKMQYDNQPLGLWEDDPFEGESIADIRGKQLLVYTDGLNEAENKQMELLGNKCLLELMADTQDLDSHQVIDMLKSAVEQHRNGAEPNDDLTMLAIHYAK